MWESQRVCSACRGAKKERVLRCNAVDIVSSMHLRLDSPYSAVDEERHKDKEVCSVSRLRRKMEDLIRKCAVYGKDEDGKMFLLRRGISEREALKVADFFYKDTGRTAIIVYSDQSREEAT